MTNQYFNQDINYGPDDAFVSSRTLGGTQQGTTDTAVLNFITITSSSTAHFTVSAQAAATASGTEITILQPGVYIASMNAADAGATCSIGISLGATAAPFTTTPVAIGTVDGLIALCADVAAADAIQMCSVTFRIAPADIDGTANILRFMGTVGAGFVTTQASMRIDRATAF
jgi:hypothetical protein